MLRSGDPAGLEQEMWALLALYQALRIAVTDAVHTVPGTDPDRASYQIAVQTAQNLVTGARGILTETTDLAGDIGRVVLANLNRPRRPRVCARRAKLMVACSYSTVRGLTPTRLLTVTDVADRPSAGMPAEG